MFGCAMLIVIGGVYNPEDASRSPVPEPADEARFILRERERTTTRSASHSLGVACGGLGHCTTAGLTGFGQRVGGTMVYQGRVCVGA